MKRVLIHFTALASFTLVRDTVSRAGADHSAPAAQAGARGEAAHGSITLPDKITYVNPDDDPRRKP